MYAPIPPPYQEMSYLDHVCQRREERGILYASVFTLCCCFLCYDTCEYCLDCCCCCWLMDWFHNLATVGILDSLSNKLKV